MIVDPLTRDSPRLLFLRSTLEPFLVCTRFFCPDRTMNILVFFRDPLNSLYKRVTSCQHSVFEFCAGLSLDDHYVKGTRQKQETSVFNEFRISYFFSYAPVSALYVTLVTSYWLELKLLEFYCNCREFRCTAYFSFFTLHILLKIISKSWKQRRI